MLCKFYMGVSHKNSIRFSLQRHFSETTKSDIIINNTVFENVLKLVHASVKGETNFYAEVGAEEDLQQLSHCFDNPTELQELLRFNTLFHFIRCGRENMRSTKNNRFAIDRDASGIEYTYR